MLAYGVTLKTVDGWQLVRAIWAARLSVGELEALIITVLRALPLKNAQNIAASFLDCFRDPLPLLEQQFMSEARLLAASLAQSIFGSQFRSVQRTRPRGFP
ncbi:MAG TPA: hypothetical protein DIU07_10135 [Rhodobacteraceae bacterium]|nr:hypothetical protein [Paracoccaceae bacterium]